MKKMLIALLALILVAVLVAGGYVAYLLIDYHRIPDMQPVEVAQNAQGKLPVGQEQTIVSWNVGFGAYDVNYSFFMDGGKESRAKSVESVQHCFDVVQETLAAQNADIILIQELDEDGDRSRHVNQRELLEAAYPNHSAAFARNYDSSYLFFPFHEPIGAAKSGILTLADVEITSSLRRSLPIETGLRKFFDLDRCYSVNRIPTSDGRELCLYNLHLSAYTKDGSIATEQIALLAQDMAAERAAGNYVIAGGDFNKDVWGDSTAYTGIGGEDYSWAKPFPLELLPTGFTLVDSCDPEAPVLTCRDTSAPYVKGQSYEVSLDAFIVSDNVQVSACGVIDTGFAVTDHNPIRMNFTLLENGTVA